MQNSAPADDKIYFLIDQPESAGQIMANTLLARDVYRNIATFVGDALDLAKQARNSADPMHHRYHNTVLIDGARGTGKSTVLINLGRYLASCNAETFEQVHICAPVDPTLLEDHDDLFLNVILAAVLSDKKVEEAQQRNPSGRQALAKQLQKLGAALEHMQNQREHTQKGMDKLRAFVGNQQLIQEVHDFFAEVLKLLDKKLLILTIDDVDTGLDKAFENLEVVRRYLTSPYVMPIISGDLSLYHEVIWRNFLGRLLEKSKEESAASVETAKELAREYERKVLPIQYRQRMPEVIDYLKNKNIYFAYMSQDEIKPLVSMPVFYAWLSALLNGTVNGLEQGFIDVPIPTTRALAQLVRQLKSLFPSLQQHMASFVEEKPWPDSWGKLLQSMKQKVFFHEVDTLGELAEKWLLALESYFSHEENACESFLVVQAFSSWQSGRFSSEGSPLDLALFNPAKNQKAKKSKRGFQNQWQTELKSLLPSTRLRVLPDNTDVFFVRPQVGVPISNDSMKKIRIGDPTSPMRSLCCNLILYKDYYNPNKMAWQRYVGRIFELIVLGFSRDVTPEDVFVLMQQPPFYSVASYTCGGDYSDEDSESDESVSDFDSTTLAIAEQQDIARKQLSDDINHWRAGVLHEGAVLSPWLVFNAMQRCFSIDFSRQLGYRGGNNPSVQFEDVFRSFGFAFFNIWAAFAYVEKGGVFGVSDAVSNGGLLWRPISQDVKYKDAEAYKQNVASLLASEKKRMSVVYMLSLHPLYEMMMESFSARNVERLAVDQEGGAFNSKAIKMYTVGMEPVDRFYRQSPHKFRILEMMRDEFSTEKFANPMSNENISSREWLRRNVLVSNKFSGFKGKIEVHHIMDALASGFPEFERANQLFYEFITKYKKTSELAPRFRDAIEMVYGRPPEPLDKPSE